MDALSPANDALLQTLDLLERAMIAVDARVDGLTERMDRLEREAAASSHKDR